MHNTTTCGRARYKPQGLEIDSMTRVVPVEDRSYQEYAGPMVHRLV